MYTEMSLKEALKYFMKGGKVLVLNEYDDKSISAERIEDCLPKEAKYLVDVPAVPNPEFEQAVREMVEAGEDDIYRDELDPDEIIQDETREGPTPTEPEERMEKETVDLPADNTKEKKEIIRKLVEEGYTNNEISDQTGIPYGTVYMHAKKFRKKEKKSVADNSDRHKCRTCQYRHSDAGGCDYCIHTGKERGCDVEVCDKAVTGARLTKK
mgnify:FL=1